jgi:phosphohistidine swiveling domain-containing protein
MNMEKYFIEESGPWYVIPLSDLRAKQHTVGSKGVWLARLSVAGLPIPTGFHITTAAYRRFVVENRLQPAIDQALEGIDLHQPATLEAAAQAIREVFISGRIPEEINVAVSLAYANLPGGFPSVAVRSSATAEDQPSLSFAGQQATYLNVSSIPALFEAIKRCWASLWTARAITYRLQHQVEVKSLAMAVVVQVLVPAQASGVLFTAQPSTGARDLAVINASWGLGEAVVGGLVTPDIYTVEKASGRVLEHRVAEKHVWAVRIAQGTEVQPIPRHLRNKSVLDDNAAARLVQLGIQIENMFNRPVDIEWTYLDGEFAIVQARPVTALPEAPTLPHLDWKAPNPKARYIRASIVELLPDPLSPLFATLGCTGINHGLQRLAEQILGSKKKLPDYELTTINGYAYLTLDFKVSHILGALTHLPHLKNLLRTSEQRWREQSRPAYLQAIERWEAKPYDALSASDLLRGIREILNQAADHYTTLQSGLLPCAGISELLFTSFYNRFVRREADPQALNFLLGFDSTPMLAEKSLYDLARWCQGHPDLAETIQKIPAYQLASLLASLHIPAGVEKEIWLEFTKYFQYHLQQFGHSIYELDFSKPLPLDDPTPLLETMKFFLSGQGNNPYLRQQKASDQRNQAYQSTLARLKGIRRSIFQRLLTWAQRFAPLREDGLADIGLGWPLMRKMLLELGKRMVQKGTIDEAEDIFWLIEDEVEQAIAELELEKEPEVQFQTVIRQRKTAWQGEKRVTPPPVLPRHSKLMGFNLEKWTPVQTGELDQVIHGVGTSPGQVVAPASVLSGPEDFGRMSQGKILVAAITTPAWTPLFALAVGVVTDVGGPLSHSSIVAREYGIPAVLGTGIASRRIQTGQTIAVDGSLGNVSLVAGQLGKPH